MNKTPRGKLAELFPRPIRPSKLAHVVIRSPRFHESRRWYADVLGAAPAFENDQLCFMTYDDEHHRIGIINMPGLSDPQPGTSGVEHFAFTFPDLGSLLSTYARLKKDGIEPFWTINHGPTISMYYRDPDGNKVELQHDVFATAEGVDAFFASGAYEENFMGVIFDPEQMIAGFEAGEPIEDLVRRPNLPEGVGPWDMVRH